LLLKAFESLALNGEASTENFVRFIIFLNGLRTNPEADAGFKGDKKAIGKVLERSSLWVIDRYEYPQARKKYLWMLDQRKLIAEKSLSKIEEEKRKPMVRQVVLPSPRVESKS